MKKIIKRSLIAILIGLTLLIGVVIYYSQVVRAIQVSDRTPDIDNTREAKVLTAFFGLEELPMQSLLLYRKGLGKNGMPLVFSQEIDPSSLQNTDFEVYTQSGAQRSVEFVTLKPANEYFELRTVLFIGNYSDYPEDQPVEVQIVDDLLSRSGQNYKGQSVQVIPLPDGPTISYAEHFVIDDDYPYVDSGGGCDCPKEETRQVVRAVWSGGVRAIDGKELGDRELNALTVTLVQAQDTIRVHPFKLADLKDGDNNLDLCLKQKGTPILVEAEANIAIDPRDDPNPETEQEIVSRW